MSSSHKKGETAISAQDLLEHSDIATTRNIYTHISEKKWKINANVLEKF